MESTDNSNGAKYLEKMSQIDEVCQDWSSRRRGEASYKDPNLSVVRPTPAVERTKTANCAVSPLTFCDVRRQAEEVETEDAL